MVADYEPPRKWPEYDAEHTPGIEPLVLQVPEYDIVPCPGWLRARLRERCTGYPPIWHGDGTVTLWHPDSPGVRIRVHPGPLRRYGVVRSPFASLYEVLRYYAARRALDTTA